MQVVHEAAQRLERGRKMEQLCEHELLYSHPGTMQFLSIFGEATIFRDKEIVGALYGRTDDAWFDGVNDPNLTAIKLAPT